MYDLNTLILVGPPNLFNMLDKEMDDFDTVKDISRFRKTFRINYNKNLYIVYSNNSDEMNQLFRKIQSNILFEDPKAVVKRSLYMVDKVDGVGDYCFVTCDERNECYQILTKLIKI